MLIVEVSQDNVSYYPTLELKAVTGELVQRIKQCPDRIAEYHLEIDSDEKRHYITTIPLATEVILSMGNNVVVTGLAYPKEGLKNIDIDILYETPDTLYTPIICVREAYGRIAICITILPYENQLTGDIEYNDILRENHKIEIYSDSYFITFTS